LGAARGRSLSVRQKASQPAIRASTRRSSGVSAAALTGAAMFTPGRGPYCGGSAR
jgi:hypothetical protein